MWYELFPTKAWAGQFWFCYYYIINISIIFRHTINCLLGFHLFSLDESAWGGVQRCVSEMAHGRHENNHKLLIVLQNVFTNNH